MKKLLLSSVALLGLTVGVTAADLPRRVAPVPYVPVPVFTWTGFYLGVNAGYGWSTNNNDDPCLGGFAFTGACGGTGLTAVTVPSWPTGAAVPIGPIVTPAFNNLGVFNNDNNRRDGFVGGGQIGYNYQFTPGGGLVIGIEADAQYNGAGRRDRDDNNFFGFGSFNGFNGFATVTPAGLPPVPGVPPGFGVAAPVPGSLGNIALFTNALGNGFNGFNGFNGSDRNRSEFLGTVRGRLGWAWDRLLVYATGGVAFTGNDNNRNDCFGGFAFSGCGFGGGGFASGGAVPAPFFVNTASFVAGSLVVPTTTNTFAFVDRRRNNDVRAVAGGGIEYAFTNNVTVKIEGLYVFDNDDDRNNNFLGFNGFGTGGGVVGVTNTGAPVIAAANNGFGLGFDRRRRDDFAIVRAGLNWKFNGWIW
jgi:outer membrane immunogenic protein